MNVFSKTHFEMRRLCTFRELKFHLLSSDPKFFISVRHGVPQIKEDAHQIGKSISPETTPSLHVLRLDSHF